MQQFTPDQLRSHYDALRKLNQTNFGTWDESLFLPGTTYSQYDCDGTQVTTAKIDGGISIDGQRYAGFKTRSPRGHLPKYRTLSPGTDFPYTDEERAALEASHAEYEAKRIRQAQADAEADAKILADPEARRLYDVWNAGQGKPGSRQNAQAFHDYCYTLTGVHRQAHKIHFD